MSGVPTPVLLSIPNLDTAGSRQVLYNLVEGLDRDLFDPSVVVLRSGGLLAERLRRLDVPVFEAPFCIEPRPYATLPLRVRKAAQTLRAAQPGTRPAVLWHSFHYRDDYTEPLIARAAGTPTWIYTKKAMGWGSRGWKLRSRLAKRIVVDNSEMIDTMFASPRLRRRCRLVHHGVHSAAFSGRGVDGPSYRHRLDVPAGAPLIVSVADLLPIKGHVDLLRALGSIHGAHLALAGGGLETRHAELLRDLSDQLGCAERIHFLGRIDDVANLLRDADLFVLASRLPGEGCPVALLEAMATGVASIATDVPGCREIITGPDVGLLVPPQSPTSLSAAISTLLDAPSRRQELAVAARQHVLTEFTVDREVEQLSLIYAELLS